MGIIGIIALVVLILICLAGLLIIPIGLPGTFVIFIAALIYNLITWSMALSFSILVIVLGIAVAGEIIEYYLGMKMAKRHGASKAGVAGAIIGGIIGAFVGVPVFLIGPLLGLFIGAFLGAFVVELILKGNPEKAFNAGIGAFYGRAGAILVKVLLGIVMVVVILSAIF